MIGETEHTCQFCYYEYFDSRAYPCSMCVCGEERTDKFQPKGRQNKRKDEPQTCSVNGRPYDCENCECFRCTADEPQTGEMMTEEEFDSMLARVLTGKTEPQTERSSE